MKDGVPVGVPVEEAVFVKVEVWVTVKVAEAVCVGLELKVGV